MLHINDTILQKVSKPARYIGREWNATNKNWDTAAVRVALAFPDIYEVGMSNLAIPILYELLNKLPGVLAERVYAPWPDMEEQLRSNNLSLYSLETRHPLRQFDIVGFSLGYELSYTTVVNMLDLAGIPVFSRERDGSYPLIIAGGSCVLNPEPLSDFIDVFFIGEVEDSLKPIIEMYLDYKSNRAELLQRLAQLPGIYVPRFYTQQYNADGILQSFESVLSGAPSKIERVIAGQLIPATMPVVPYIEVIHDRGAVEIQRGCSRGCRFCQAGVLYRPVRELPEETAVSIVDQLVKNCGYNTISLVSLSTGDYSSINHLVDTLTQKNNNNGISISLPSLRLDKSSIDLIQSLPQGRKTTLTFAPEAGSERLRNAINKVIPEDSMLETFAAAFEKNWMNLKLYFMVGLPTETFEDVRAIAALTGKICRLGKSIRGRMPGVRVSVSSFVPKPHTPCQWAAQDSEEQLVKKQSLLLHELRRSGAQLSWHDPSTSLLEAALSRGDRRMGKVIYTAWKKGSRLDTWSEFFNFSRWQEAFSDCGIDPSFYANRERPLDEVLPWQHIDTGTGLDFLKSEYLKMQSGDTTPDCRFQSCNLCGLQKRHAACRLKAAALKKDDKFDFEAKTG